MSSFPCLARFVSGSGQVRYRLGDRLVDRYLEFVAGRCRPDTLRAVAFDLKTFFTVIGKDPVQVTAADVFDFLADQRGDRTVVRLADRESGLSARTIAAGCSRYGAAVVRGLAHRLERGTAGRWHACTAWARGRLAGSWRRPVAVSRTGRTGPGAAHGRGRRARSGRP